MRCPLCKSGLEPNGKIVTYTVGDDWIDEEGDSKHTGKALVCPKKCFNDTLFFTDVGILRALHRELVPFFFALDSPARVREISNLLYILKSNDRVAAMEAARKLEGMRIAGESDIPVELSMG